MGVSVRGYILFVMAKIFNISKGRHILFKPSQLTLVGLRPYFWTVTYRLILFLKITCLSGNTFQLTRLIDFLCVLKLIINIRKNIWFPDSMVTMLS